MAPEVVLGELYGTSQDVWGFGVTLFELLHARVRSPRAPATMTEPCLLVSPLVLASVPFPGRGAVLGAFVPKRPVERGCRSAARAHVEEPGRSVGMRSRQAMD